MCNKLALDQGVNIIMSKPQLDCLF